MFEKLKEEVLQANKDLVRLGLVTLTWGNASGISRADRRVVIKPSGVEYESMALDDMVVLDMEGRVVYGRLRPSSDTPAHLELYKAFPAIGSIVHMHSLYATMFAQACREIPCLGTTHADYFNGPVPVTRFVTAEEVAKGYEKATATVIIERFAGLDPLTTPGVIVAGHAPFVWGKNCADAIRNGFLLEKIAELALGTLQLNPGVATLPAHIQNKHYQRKHGPDAYYGQKR